MAPLTDLQFDDYYLYKCQITVKCFKDLMSLGGSADGRFKWTKSPISWTAWSHVHVVILGIDWDRHRKEKATLISTYLSATQHKNICKSVFLRATIKRTLTNPCCVQCMVQHIDCLIVWQKLRLTCCAYLRDLLLWDTQGMKYLLLNNCVPPLSVTGLDVTC